jgi:lysyl-tRNA synthetase, class II
VTDDVQGDIDAPEQMQVRRAKLDRLRAAGIDPYPVGYPRTDTIAQVRERHPGLPPDAATGDRVGVTGRVVLSRIGGKLCFATIRDGSGDIQVMISQERVGAGSLAAWKQDVDLGDHIGVTGEVITSRSGELSVLADSYAITAKALRPLPDKHRGLGEEARVRQRYLDLITNPEARRMAEIRAAVTRSVREELHARGYLEVETPVLQTLHGGANARPFVTHMNATCTCASRWSCTSSDWSWAGSRGSTRSAASSATRAPTPPTTPSSPCSRRTRPTATTTPSGR